MQKNWYVVYTKSCYENKVSQLLSKKGIENFYPVNQVNTDLFKKPKIIQKPIFQNYVFVCIDLGQSKIVKQTIGVINLAFWKGTPAIIDVEEINEIKLFSKNYQNIQVEKSKVNKEERSRYIDESDYSVDGNLFSSKNKILKLYLPSLGYTLVSKFDNDSFYHKETIFINKTTFTHS